MPHERRVRRGEPSAGAPERHRATSKAQVTNVFLQLQSDIKALNSSVLILSQKMQYLVRNEKILGRNLIVLSKRIREIDANGTGTGGPSETTPQTLDALSQLSDKLDAHGQKILDLQNEVADIKDHYAKNEELKEMKYLIDTMNPMDFVTLKQFDELLKKKLKKKK